MDRIMHVNNANPRVQLCGVRPEACGEEGGMRDKLFWIMTRAGLDWMGLEFRAWTSFAHVLFGRGRPGVYASARFIQTFLSLVHRKIGRFGRFGRRIRARHQVKHPSESSGPTLVTPTPPGCMWVDITTHKNQGSIRMREGGMVWTNH